MNEAISNKFCNALITSEFNGGGDTNSTCCSVTLPHSQTKSGSNAHAPTSIIGSAHFLALSNIILNNESYHLWIFLSEVHIQIPVHVHGILSK